MFIKDLSVIDESLHDQFTEVEKDGVKGYQDNDSLELKKHLSNTKSDKLAYSEKNTLLSERLDKIEADKQEEIERLAQEKYDKAIADGKTEEVAERLKQQMTDLETRKNGEIESVTEQLNALKGKTKTSAIDAIVNELGAMATEKDRNVFKKLLRSQVDYDIESGKPVFLDESGGATSLDLSGFKAEVAKNSDYDSLLSAEFLTVGGGNVNGGQRGGAVTTTLSKQAQDAKKKGDLSNFLKHSLKVNN